MKVNYEPKYHRDGTVTYWSVCRQEWIKKAKFVPDTELAAMDKTNRGRIRIHTQWNDLETYKGQTRN